jgi:fructokinase
MAGAKFNIIGIGEILWDLLPAGKQLGGAPANFAYHAGALGAKARVISRVGRDDLGEEVLDRLKKLGLPLDTIEIDPAAPTGTVSVTIDPHGQPQYAIHENVAWDNLSGDSVASTAVRAADGICFGTLAQRSTQSRATIRELVGATPPAALRIFDVNLRQHYYSAELIRDSLALVNILKVNDAELPLIADLLGITGNVRSQIATLGDRFNLTAVACTRGEHGSLLYSRDRWSEHPGLPTKVADTIGAGDSFTAALTLGLLLRWDLDTINQHANEVASFVASSRGATPTLPPELRAPFVNQL